MNNTLTEEEALSRVKYLLGCKSFTAFQRMRIHRYLPHIYEYMYQVNIIPSKGSCRDIQELDSTPQPVKFFERELGDLYPSYKVRVIAKQTY